MKNNYKVQEFSLKRIAENLDKIPRNGVFDNDEKPTLTKEQKRRLMDMVSRFNEYGKVLRCEQAIADTAKALSEIAEMAETYACNEAADYFQAETIKRDFKDLQGRTGEFKKIAKECNSNILRLNALYEDCAHVLERYFEIKDIQEVLRRGPALDADPAERETMMGEISVSPQDIHTDRITGEENLEEIRQTPTCTEMPLHKDGFAGGRP